MSVSKKRKKASRHDHSDKSYRVHLATDNTEYSTYMADEMELCLIDKLSAVSHILW